MEHHNFKWVNPLSMGKCGEPPTSHQCGETKPADLTKPVFRHWNDGTAGCKNGSPNWSQGADFLRVEKVN